MRLIDLDKLKQNLCGECTMNFPKECRQIGCTKVDKQDILEALRLPIIDAVPVRHGKWIQRTEYIDDMGFTGCRCSECNYWKPMGVWHYCPNCGARMDEERKEE